MYIKKGKKTKEWESARAVLKRDYFDRGITYCELGFNRGEVNGCTGMMFLGMAHRYKRTDVRCKHTFDQTILACTYCHNLIEYDKELTELCFEYLRGGYSVPRTGCMEILRKLRVDRECKKK